MAGRFSLESRTLEQPGSVRQWMQSFDLTLFCGKAQRFRADAEEGRALRQVHPTFGLTRFGMTDGDFVVAAKRRHPFARNPAPTCMRDCARSCEISSTRIAGVDADAFSPLKRRRKTGG
jgi:hypothetical protein